MGKKRQNLSRSKTFDIDEWRKKAIRKRVLAAFAGRAYTKAEYREEYARQEQLFLAERRAQKAAKRQLASERKTQKVRKS